MRNVKKILFTVILLIVLSGCTNRAESLEESIKHKEQSKFSVAVLLSDTGMGDQSLNDLAIQGLMEAEEELDVLWTYKEAPTASDAEKYLKELVLEGHDLIIGVTYTAKESLEKIAAQYPEQQFVLIDTESELQNIDAITFKENEGSYLAGIVAANATKSGKIGFIGGVDDPVIHKFLEGFEKGARTVNPSILVNVQYANTYADAEVGAKVAQEMILQNTDVLYAVAGYTGVGVLEEAQRRGKYAIGVDTDQYTIAEKAIITSMTKNVDITLFNYIENYLENEPTEQLIIEAGIAENGVGLAPIRILSNANALEKQIEEAKANLK